CRACPVREACLEAAKARREPWGVWGGELFANGKVLAQKRKRGRPPKGRPPEPVFDEWGQLVPQSAGRDGESVDRARSPQAAGRGDEGRQLPPDAPSSPGLPAVNAHIDH